MNDISIYSNNNKKKKRSSHRSLSCLLSGNMRTWKKRGQKPIRENMCETFLIYIGYVKERWNLTLTNQARFENDPIKSQGVRRILNQRRINWICVASTSRCAILQFKLNFIIRGTQMNPSTVFIESLLAGNHVIRFLPRLAFYTDTSWHFLYNLDFIP